MPDATVKAIFAGDATSLDRTFKQVGSGAKTMAADMDAASSSGRRGFNDLATGVDESERKFRGFGDTIAGTGDIMQGFKDGNIVGVAMGFADLAGGITDFVVPAIKSMAAKFGLMTGATTAQATATEGAAVAQGGLNAALLANPIGLVVLAIAALVAAFVIAWKNSETFRNIVTGAFDAIKTAAGWLIDKFKEIGSAIGAAFTTGVAVAKDMINGLIGLVERGLNFVMTPYRAASGFLNKIPGVGSAIPDFLTRDISLPRLAMGGPVMPGRGYLVGERGPELFMPTLAGAIVANKKLGGPDMGEAYTPGKPGYNAPGGVVVNVVVQGHVLDGKSLGNMVHDALLNKQRSTPLGLT